MRKVLVGGYVYKEETFSLPDEFDKIYDRFMELDGQNPADLTFEENEELDDLARQMWEEVYIGHGFDTPLILESGDGKNIIWET